MVHIEAGSSPEGQPQPEFEEMRRAFGRFDRGDPHPFSVVHEDREQRPPKRLHPSKLGAIA
jgi:hypothetical protein